MPKALFYVLTDPSLRSVWIGGGTRPLNQVNLLLVPRWEDTPEDRQRIRRAARALHLSGFKLVPSAVSLPTRR